ncbi:MAG TPA: PQQ-binding-like beta-propeller repeat protein, partial [Phenylobacterium sp.]
MASDKPASWPARIWATIGGGLVALFGAALLLGGGWLIVLGGSPYYLLAGAAILGSGVMLVRRHPAAGLLYAVVLAATLGWGVWEGGFSFWPLLPRLFAPAVLGLFILAVIPAAPVGAMRDRSGAAVALLSLICLAVLGAAAPATYRWGQAEIPAQVTGAAPQAAASDWRYEGGDPGGSRYAPLDQINRENVEKLRLAWTFHSVGEPRMGGQGGGAALQVGDALYVCTPANLVVALDADTGRDAWRNAPEAKPGARSRCSGLGYWDPAAPRHATPRPAPAVRTAPGKPAPPPVQKTGAPGRAGPLCERRIIAARTDARLVALDAATGQPCPGFGKDGVVDLTIGLGTGARGARVQTSSPAVIGDRVIVGSRLAGNQALSGPSGVVRAFDVVTGELVWAWDLGAPSVDKLPADGKAYTRGTPYLASTPAFDARLGLVYLPLGGAAPGHWGSHRAMAS